MQNRDRVLALLAAIESNNLPALQARYAADVIQREFPNQLMPQGATRNFEQLMEGHARGQQLLRTQRYDVLGMLCEGDKVAFEATWTGELNIDAPSLGLLAGDTMTAHFAQFITFRDGLIVRHDTYDCFDDWRSGKQTG